MNRAAKEGRVEAEVVYLRHLEETRRWLENVLNVQLPSLSEFERSLSNGVVLCMLGQKVLPSDPMWAKVYDKDESKFKTRGLDYRHTDNINFFLSFMKKTGLPKVFYPSTLDIYEQRNQPHLIYTLHALSHYLRNKGLVSGAVETIQGDIFCSEGEISEAVHTINRGVKSQDVEVFRDVKDLVTEELQYQAMGMEDDEEEPQAIEEDEIYDTFQGIDTPAHRTVPASVRTEDNLLAVLDCARSSVRVRVYEKGLMKEFGSEEEHLLQVLALAIDKAEKVALVKLLHNPLFGELKVLPSEDACDLYFDALKQLRGEEQLPQNVLCVYSGLSRTECEDQLQNMDPGSYILRESMTHQGQLAISFRNIAGIKHWIISIVDGQYKWGQSQLFPSLDSFLMNWSQALSENTGLTVAMGMCPDLYPPDWKNVKKLSLLASTENTLSLKLVKRVVEGVNHQLLRKEKLKQEEESRHKQEQRAKLLLGNELRLQEQESKLQTESPSERASSEVKQTKKTGSGEKWNRSLILHLGREGAESVLLKYGRPGSFLVRPSEKNPSDFAIVFRTKSEIKNWKVTLDKNKYIVKPYPQSYNSLEDVVKLFVDALNGASNLQMEPLVLPKSVLDDMFGYKSVGCGNGRDGPTVEETPSPDVTDHSEKAKANIRKWSSDQVYAWMLERGLEQFAASFRKQEVDGECLMSLDHAELRDDLGVSALGHRHRILRCIKSLTESTNS